MTLVESPVLWQALLCMLGGYLFSMFAHSLFAVPKSIVRAMSG